MKNTKYLILFFFFGITAFCFSQNKITLDIQPNKNSYPEKNYSFTKIIDARANKVDLGVIYRSDRVNQYHAVFKHPLEKEVYLFLIDVFPNTYSQNRILIVIHEFEVGHILSKKDTGFVRLNFNFYRLRNDSASFISNYSNTLSETAEDVSLSHANRLKRALLHAANDMEIHLQSTTNDFKPLSFIYTGESKDLSIQKSLSADSVKSKSQNTPPPAYDYSDRSKEDSLIRKNNYPASHIVMLGGYWNPCTSEALVGGSVSILFRLQKHKRFLLGFNLNYSGVKFYDRNGLPLDQSYRLRASDFGLRMLGQIKNIFFFNANPHLLLGKETYTTFSNKVIYNSLNQAYSVQQSQIEKSNTFTGFQLDLGLYVMHPQRTSGFFGIDLTMRFTNSYIFDSDVGIKLNLGLKF